MVACDDRWPSEKQTCRVRGSKPNKMLETAVLNIVSARVQQLFR